jgi:hypothetical protein
MRLGKGRVDMRAQKSVTLAAAILLIAPVAFVAVPFGGSAQENGRSPPPFGAGNWTVTGSETVRDGILVLDGNLTVESGGSLTLINYTLQILCRQGSPHCITVKSGGRLNVLSGSVVGSFDNSYKDYARHNFTIDAGATAVFENSSFLAAGVLEHWQFDSEMGGILTYTDMTVRNCTFSGSRTAITAFYSTVLFDHCTFRGSDRWACAVSWGSNVQFDNCTFEQNYIGVIPYRSDCSFVNCSFTDNFLGAVPDSSSCDFAGCLFSRNAYTGLYCNPQMGINTAPDASTIYLRDSLFLRNTVGIAAYWGWADAGGAVFPLMHDLYITNCEFRDNTQAGMLWPRSDPDIPRENSPCTWTVTARAGVYNNTMDFNGDMGIEAGGEMTLSRSDFSLDPGYNGWNGVEVKGSGALRVRDNSTLRSANASIKYALACRPGSIFELDGSSLRDCGWDGSVPEHAGPLVETSRLNVSHSAIWACPYALYLSSSKGAVIESTILAGSAGGLMMNGSSARVSNSTIGCATLQRGSLLDSVNSSLNTDRLNLDDVYSSVSVGWYLDLRAAWEDMRPAAGANVTIRDLDGHQTFNGSCGADGSLAQLVLWEATLYASGMAMHTPHSVDCSLGPVHNITSVEMLASLRLTVTLSDKIAPNVSVTSPAASSFVGTGTVLAFGSARDDMALMNVEVSVDSGDWRTVFESEANATASADWNLTLELDDGFHTLVAQATDASGNTGSSLVTFIVDTTAPNVFITSPAPGFLTNLSDLAVSGLAEPGSSVTVNGVAARASGSSFSAVIRLSEGDNDITAIAVDAAGNSNRSSIRVRLDTVPPEMTVRYDPPGTSINRPQLNISGEMENGSSVTVNGRWIVLPGLASSFATLILLHQGANAITIVVTDRAGNINISRATVTFDTTPPAVDFIYPPDRLLTRESPLTLKLVVEGGSVLNVGGQIFPVEAAPSGPGGKVPFNLTLNLTEGTNVIAVGAQDAAGNRFAASRQIVLDTIAPALAIYSPADGFRTSNDSVFVVGQAEPGSIVRVQGMEVVVGLSGDFGAEVRLGAGNNRITVQAEDSAGNLRELEMNVTQTAGRHGEPLVIESRPDWMFGGFLILSAAAVAAEGVWMRRRLGKRGTGAGKVG